MLGRSERLDPLHAALINGISSHVFDYDDTHLRTMIHPAGPVASRGARLRRTSQGVRAGTSSTRWCSASRSNAGSATRSIPAHYDIGWHITGTAGVFGAAAAVGKLLGLDTSAWPGRSAWPPAQPVGLREMFGTMTKSFHPGRAAQNGMTAALLAERGFTSSNRRWRPSAAGPMC